MPNLPPSKALGTGKRKIYAPAASVFGNKSVILHPVELFATR